MWCAPFDFFKRTLKNSRIQTPHDFSNAHLDFRGPETPLPLASNYANCDDEGTAQEGHKMRGVS